MSINQATKENIPVAGNALLQLRKVPAEAAANLAKAAKEVQHELAENLRELGDEAITPDELRKKQLIEALAQTTANSNHKPIEKIKTTASIFDKVLDFISNEMVKYTTIGSMAINFLSAPTRLVEKGPIKDILNKISMIATKTHLLTYATAGVQSAVKQKNPFLVFSFAIEGVTALMKLSQIYLFRGLATGIDGAMASLKDRYKKASFKSMKEGFSHNWMGIREVVKETLTNPKLLLDAKGNHLGVVSGFFMALGSIFGVSVNEKIGGAVRDISGGLNDWGVYQIEDKDAKKSGFFYITGTIVDFIARVFNDPLANILGITEHSAFKRLKDMFHELAIALDRAGQYYFLRYNQKDDLKAKAA